jgi:hypothetical protein
VLWAGVALYIRVRRHLKAERAALVDTDTQRNTELL